VCVAYVEHNSTHYLNVNKALLVEGHAIIWNFDNEFDPNTWSLYYPKADNTESQSTQTQVDVIIVAILVTVVTVIGIVGLSLYTRGGSRSRPRHRLIRWTCTK
jgi:hypothetical protein